MKNTIHSLPFQIYSGQILPIRFEADLLLFFGLRGTSRIECRGKSFTIYAAGIFAVNPLEVYRLYCPPDASLLCMRIPSSTLTHAGLPGTCDCYIPSGEGETKAQYRIKQLVAEIFQGYFEQKQSESIENTRKIREFLQELQAQFPSRSVAQHPREATMNRLGRILESIESRWNEELTLNMIAKEEYLSVSYLSRFFQKNLHMSFSGYLRELRLGHGAEMLIKNNTSITHIAYSCGFRAPSVFIEAFKQQYGQTPGQYRQQKQEDLQKQIDPKSEHDSRGDVNILLAYLPEEVQNTLPHRNREVFIDGADRIELPGTSRGRILNIGYARDGLLAPVQQQILQASREIGFEFIRFHGLFDQDMHIYWEDKNGDPQLCFYDMDLLFDFILTTDLKPFVELSFMPFQLAREQIRIYDRPSIISGCSQPEKWEALVRGVLKHLIERYGIREVRSWRFTTIGLSYVHLECVSWEDYQRLYQTTCHAIKGIDKELQFGGPGCFAELMEQEQGIPAFLEFTRERDCIPDFITFQCYPHVHTYDSLFMNFTISQQSAPAILSDDVDYLKHSLDKLEELLNQSGLSNRGIYVEESTSTLWQRDISGDTCYKAVWLAKNLADSYGRAVFGYWLLTDLLEERAKIESVFHGGYGLMTYNGIPKAGYQAMKLFGRMGTSVVARGEGWLLTREERAGAYQLLVYNYCHYSNLYCHRYQRLRQPEDAYSVFESGVVEHMQFVIRGLESGTYRIERHRISRARGSSFDKWMEIGSPAYTDERERAYLIDQSEPFCQMERITVDRSIHIESVLEPQMVELIEFTPC